MKRVLPALFLLLFTSNPRAFELDGFVGFENRQKAAEATRKFLLSMTKGGIDEASDVFWTEDIEVKRKVKESLSSLAPVLPQLGKRNAQHFAGAITIGEFWFELGYIEVFESAVVFSTVSFARPGDGKWYFKNINYTVKSDISKLIEEIPAAYKKLITSEKNL